MQEDAIKKTLQGFEAVRARNTQGGNETKAEGKP